ncbi:class I SAM-dependent methyltransferase [Halomonas cupida]|uniref:class I SAM-dependent methyltransferase n=1 Tax=Halomonas cupida TaxID=44933 RepID=UPI003A90BA71
MSYFHNDGRRDFFRCGRCDLVAVPPHQRLDPVAEKAIYDQHDNRPDDPGYRAFLARLMVPLGEHLAPRAEGLDFGAGPGPTLSLMFEEAGFMMQVHDPFFAPNPEAMQRQYDFITATEVAEHLFTPGETLGHLVSCLRPGGWLGLMTMRIPEDFANWHYIRDPSHVVFFSDLSLAWFARQHGLTLTLAGREVALLQRPG